MQHSHAFDVGSVAIDGDAALLTIPPVTEIAPSSPSMSPAMRRMAPVVRQMSPVLCNIKSLIQRSLQPCKLTRDTCLAISALRQQPRRGEGSREGEAGPRPSFGAEAPMVRGIQSNLLAYQVLMKHLPSFSSSPERVTPRPDAQCNLDRLLR
ncbi:hypothetical protein PG985_013189 [Apiospora marii]|uniref:Uncharacterized protein n=1 Tax=Apiospora marii TaxID=335849 RepID=A0ABR1R9H9_9PEZI